MIEVEELNLIEVLYKLAVNSDMSPAESFTVIKTILRDYLCVYNNDNENYLDKLIRDGIQEKFFEWVGDCIKY